MDAFAFLRAMGALALLLSILAGALWAVRRFDLRLPGAVGRGSERRLELVERLGIDQRRSAVLIRRDDREYLLLISPEGQVVVDSLERREPPAGDTNAAEDVPQATRAGPQSFAALLDTNLAGWKRVARRNFVRSSDRKH